MFVSCQLLFHTVEFPVLRLQVANGRKVPCLGCDVLHVISYVTTMHTCRVLSDVSMTRRCSALGT